MKKLILKLSITSIIFCAMLFTTVQCTPASGETSKNLNPAIEILETRSTPNGIFTVIQISGKKFVANSNGGICQIQ